MLLKNSSSHISYDALTAQTGYAAMSMDRDKSTAKKV